LVLLLRLLQGLALGGEYGGAATYVAEHSPIHKRGFYTSWIQTTATLITTIQGTNYLIRFVVPDQCGSTKLRDWFLILIE